MGVMTFQEAFGNSERKAFCILSKPQVDPKKVSSAAAAAKSLQSCPTLYDPTDDSPPGTTVPGILQARTLEWVAISFSNARLQNHCRR